MNKPYFVDGAHLARLSLKILALTFAAGCFLNLSGCAKKGPLEVPPGYEETDKAARIIAERKALKNPKRGRDEGSILRSTVGEVEPAAANTKFTPLDPQPFILDALVE